MKKRVQGFLIVSLLLGGCIVSMGNVARDSSFKNPSKIPKEVLRRCDFLRTWRDVYANAAIGTSVLGGAGGLTALGFDHSDSKRHVAEVGLAIGAIGAILAAVAKTTGDAYSDEGCSDVFSSYRKEWQPGVVSGSGSGGVGSGSGGGGV